MFCLCSIMLYTVELLDFMVAQFSWCSKVAVPYEFTSSTKTNFKLKSNKKTTKILMIPQYMYLIVIQIKRLTWLIRPSYEVFTGYKQYTYKNTKSCFWDS